VIFFSKKEVEDLKEQIKSLKAQIDLFQKIVESQRESTLKIQYITGYRDGFQAGYQFCLEVLKNTKEKSGTG
jgi:flagellar biosynthesis/type III secretory pathway protein FliH